MLCPKCKKTLKVDTTLSKEGKNVYKFYVVGADVKTGETYCPLCVAKRK